MTITSNASMLRPNGALLVAPSASASGAVVFISTNETVLLSRADNDDDIAEGLRGLKEPTVATWADVKAQLGL